MWQDMLPILTELRHSLDIQMELETLVENGKYCQVVWKIHVFHCGTFGGLFLILANVLLQAFQLLPEYLQVLDNYAQLSVIQEMGRGIEVSFLQQEAYKQIPHLTCWINCFASSFSFGIGAQKNSMLGQCEEELINSFH